jgi:hypothetical protein
MQSRCLTHRSVGAHYRRQKVEARLIHKQRIVVPSFMVAPFSARGPALLFPVPYGLLVSLVRPTHRFVQGESQRPHQPADVRRMVTYAKLLADLTSATRAHVHTSPLKP